MASQKLLAGRKGQSIGQGGTRLERRGDGFGQSENPFQMTRTPRDPTAPASSTRRLGTAPVSRVPLGGALGPLSAPRRGQGGNEPQEVCWRSQAGCSGHMQHTIKHPWASAVTVRLVTVLCRYCTALWCLLVQCAGDLRLAAQDTCHIL